MDENNQNNLSATNKTSLQQSFGVPAAIVIAGGLIALAIFYGGGKQRPITDLTDDGGEGANQGNPTAAEISFRPISNEDHIRGTQDAKVTILEYSDIECPFCKRFHPTVARILSEYPQDVRWVYRHFPLEQLHANARIAAVASECAGAQGKFWELLDHMFESTESGSDLDKAKLPTLAQEAGVPNIEVFTACLDSNSYNDKINADLADAQTAGGRGTPYSLIISQGAQPVPINGAQPYDVVKQVIEQAL